jgi:hypothetical protein
MAMKLARSEIISEGYVLVELAGKELEPDFQKDGVEAKWAEYFPKIWGSEKKKIEYGNGHPIQAISLSDDEAFLAVAVGQDVNILCADTFEVIGALHGTLQAKKALFKPSKGEYGEGYILAAFYVDYQMSKYPVVCWHLGRDGERCQPDDTPYDVK